eukprot:sb/3463885/
MRDSLFSLRFLLICCILFKCYVTMRREMLISSLSQFSRLSPFKEITIDDGWDQLNRSFMFVLMVICGTVVTVRQHTGSIISCNGFSKYDASFSEDYCWTQGLYTIREAYNENSMHVPYPGLIPEEVPLCLDQTQEGSSMSYFGELLSPPCLSGRTALYHTSFLRFTCLSNINVLIQSDPDLKNGGKSGSDCDNCADGVPTTTSRVYHLWYQWIPFYFWLAAAAFFLPYLIYKRYGFGDLKPLIAMLYNPMEGERETHLPPPHCYVVQPHGGRERDPLTTSQPITNRSGFGDLKPLIAMLYNPMEGEEGIKADAEKASVWLYHRFAIYMNEHSMYANFMQRHGIGLLVIGIKICYLIVSVLLMTLTAEMFELADFKQYGIVWAQQWPDPPANVTGIKDLLFPKMVACEIKRWGPTGLEDENGMCVLAPNVINQYIFLILWWSLESYRIPNCHCVANNFHLSFQCSQLFLMFSTSWLVLSELCSSMEVIRGCLPALSLKMIPITRKYTTKLEPQAGSI